MKDFFAPFFVLLTQKTDEIFGEGGRDEKKTDGYN